MANVLIVSEHRRHDAVAEVVETRLCQDCLCPKWQLLFLRIGGFVVLFSNPHQDADGVVVKGDTNRVRLKQSVRVSLI